MAKKQKKKKKNSGIKKFFLVVMIIIVLLISAFFIGYNVLLGGINKVDITGDEDELNVNKGLNKNIINIALFGIDTRDDNYNNSRSDTIIIGTLDKEHQKLKLSSVMRDTYVSIPGRGYDKINHSYSFGGPELAIKTLNQNFDLNVTDYITVNFDSLKKIVDAVGGVEIDIKSYEISHIPGINSTGVHNLNGEQALAYSRIRKSGSGDYERTERQRTVIEKIFQSVVSEGSLAKALVLIDTISPYVETSLSNTEMVGYATTIYTSKVTQMEDTRIPLDDYSNGGMWNGVYYLKPDTLEDNVIYLHKFIYEEDNYTPTSIINEISNGI